jgi:hypothetical protein
MFTTSKSIYVKFQTNFDVDRLGQKTCTTRARFQTPGFSLQLLPLLAIVFGVVTTPSQLTEQQEHASMHDRQFFISYQYNACIGSY